MIPERMTYYDKRKHILTLKTGDIIWTWELKWNEEKNAAMVNIYSVPIIEPFGVIGRYGRRLDFNENPGQMWGFYPTYMDALDDAIIYFETEIYHAQIKLRDNSELLDEALLLKRDYEEAKRRKP